MDLLTLVECYAILTEGLTVALKHHMQLSFKPRFLQLTPFRWLDEALASLHCGLGAGCSTSNLFLCCFSIRKWLENMGKQCFLFCKTPLLKKRTSERLSLLFISSIEIYNPLSALLLTLVSIMCFSQLPFSYSMLLYLQTLKGDKQNCPPTLFFGKFTDAKLSNFLPHKPYTTVFCSHHCSPIPSNSFPCL